MDIKTRATIEEYRKIKRPFPPTARPPGITGYHPQARQRISGSAAVQAASRPPDGGVALRAGAVRDGFKRGAAERSCCGRAGRFHGEGCGIRAAVGRAGGSGRT
jgi:hypothetical protein